MSLFPKRLKPGGSLIIHIRTQRRPKQTHHFNFIRVIVENPSGEKRVIQENVLLKFPVSHKMNFNRKSINKNIFSSSPPATFAEYLFQEQDRTDWFFRVFKEYLKINQLLHSTSDSSQRPPRKIPKYTWMQFLTVS